MDSHIPYGAMSDRTISPATDASRAAAQNAGQSYHSPSLGSASIGQMKRKWSPEYSETSSATVTFQNNRPSSLYPVTSQASWSARSPKRTRPGDGVPSARHKAFMMMDRPMDNLHLSPELWQWVFTFLPPSVLGQLLRVNKTFHSLLTPSSTQTADLQPSSGVMRRMDPNHVWSLSRRAFCPKMPRPLVSRSELSMWRLLGSSRCQYCSKQGASIVPPGSTSPWAAGPGAEFIRVVWPFSVRSCGACLSTRLRKETDIMFSDFGVLLPALPFAFLTPSQNYVTSVTLKREPPPPGLQLIKWYFGPQLEEMKAKLDEVRRLGSGAAEEWFKGFEAGGRTKADDAARWEHWELTGGFHNLADSIYQARVRAHRRPDGHDRQDFSSVEALDPPSFSQTNNGILVNNPPMAAKNEQQWHLAHMSSNLPQRPTSPTLSHGFIGSHPTTAIYAPTSYSKSENPRASVTERINARRAEIERRAALLNPPIRASTLTFMDSFRSSLLIAMPLTDQAWDVLRPRLIAQRSTAEQCEQEQLAQSDASRYQIEEQQQQESQLQAAKESVDREWDESQRSVRDKLDLYADAFVRDHWQNGEMVTEMNAPQFAVDVLQHVRHHFYTALAQEDARMRAMGVPVPTDSPYGASSRRLTLDTMRWIYERKIKPHTERFEKELLFLCSGCENHAKYYSLDSVIQHFAAKHTDSLSRGNATVYWKAEWPESPPFHLNPTAARASMYAVGNNSPGLSTSGPYHKPEVQQHPLNPYGTPLANQGVPPALYYDQPQHGMNTSPIYPPIGADRMASANTFHNGNAYSNPHTHGLYSAPQQGNHYSQPQYSSQQVTHQLPVAPQYGGQQVDPHWRPGSAASNYSAKTSHPAYVQQGSYYPRPHIPPNHVQPPIMTRPAQPTMYQVQLQELASNARDLWNNTAGIEAMPDSVRVQVIIQHVVQRFKEKYPNEPSLSLFIDGLNNSPQMSPLRSLNGLICRGCVIKTRLLETHGFPNSASQSGRMHTLPALVAHFQSGHVGDASIAHSPMPRPDWKSDMVELPDPSLVRAIMYTSSIDQAKLNLVASALPSYFPSPLPNVDPHPYQVATSGFTTQPSRAPYHPDPLSKRDVADRASHRLHTSFDRTMDDAPLIRYQDAHRHSINPSYTAPSRNTLKEVETTPEDEYDPHRPAYMRSSNTVKVSARSFPNEGAEGTLFRRPDRRADPTFRFDDRYRTEADDRFAPTHQESARPSYEDMQRTDDTTMANSEPLSARSNREAKPIVSGNRSPSNDEPLNAAERFLQNFELATEYQREPAGLALGPATRRMGHNLDGNESPATGSRKDEFGWGQEESRGRRPGYSDNSSPNDSLRAMDRYHGVEDDGGQPPSARDGRGPYDRYLRNQPMEHARSSNQSPDPLSMPQARSKQHVQHARNFRNSPAGRPSSRFERYEAVRQRSLERSPSVVTQTSPRDRASFQESLPAERRALRPVSIVDIDEPNRYYDGYSENAPYERSVGGAPAIRYYVQRELYNDTTEYASHHVDDQRDYVAERSGRLISRAQPSRTDHRDHEAHYPRQTTYER